MHSNGSHDAEVKLLVKQKPAYLLNSSPPHQPLNRSNAWFINTHGLPHFPSAHKLPTLLHPNAGNAFSSCRTSPPPTWWPLWVDKLKPIYGHLWRQSGIYDAIQSSLHNVTKDSATILSVSAFWCSETNTFVFPWGEATVTLEDILLLGGFSVTGESLSTSLDDELALLDRRVNDVRRNFNNSSAKKSGHKSWMEYFSTRNGDELEHVGFLALWLSRWVFAKPASTVTQPVIPIAVRLARGARIALAPAVLASLYSSLKVTKDSLTDNAYDEHLLGLPAFQILQVWIRQHFAELRTDQQMDFSSIISVLERPGKFRWRPYEFGLQDWCFREGEGSRDDSLLSLAQFLNASLLVGVDCIEHYSPHRVAMQFGLDQDVPGFVQRIVGSREDAWETYDLSSEDFEFDLELPECRLEPGVSTEYLQWWKQNVSSVTTFGIDELKRHKHSFKKGGKFGNSTVAAERRKLKKSKVEEHDEVPLSAWLNFHTERIRRLKRDGKDWKTRRGNANADDDCKGIQVVKAEDESGDVLRRLAWMNPWKELEQGRERWEAAREADMKIIKKLKEEIAAMDIVLNIKRVV